MNLAFLVPGALWALAALSVPVLLHLVRRRQSPQRLDFAALAWLEHAPRPRRRLRLRDPWLLLLRCLLLAAVALALAQPVLHGGSPARDWHLVASGVDIAALDGRDQGAWRWLAPGFPTLDAAPPPHVETASLIRAFDAGLPAGDRLHVHVPAALAGLDGARIALSREVVWRVWPGASPVPDRDTRLHVAVPEDADPRLHAALRAWNAGTEDADRIVRVPAEAPTPEVQALLWPADSAPPETWQRWVGRGGRVLTRAPLPTTEAQRRWTSRGAVVLDVARHGDGVWATLHCPALEAAARARVSPFRAPGAAGAPAGSRCETCALVPACLPELLEPDFPRLLRTWLAPLPDRHPPASAAHLAPSADGPPPLPPGEPLLPWLGWLAAALFALERTIVARRRPP